MTEQEKIEALVRHRLEQATEAVSAAELNLANGLQRSTVNRAYYAMFYAVLALARARVLGWRPAAPRYSPRGWSMTWRLPSPLRSHKVLVNTDRP